MVIPVLVIGESGSGKSASIENLPQDDTLIIKAENKILPFFKKFDSVYLKSYAEILKAIQETDRSIVVIDDFQFLMLDEMILQDKMQFESWFLLAKNVRKFMLYLQQIDADKRLYILTHSQKDDMGHEKAKTCGKMLDNTFTLESMFTIVLKTVVKDFNYYFQVHSNGLDTVKTPKQMFKENYIANDLMLIEEKIKDFI